MRACHSRKSNACGLVTETDVPPDDLPTLIAIGVLAVMTAVLSHELVGHGVGCLAGGGSVRLVSTINFRCDGATALSDLGGPIGNLVLGVIVLAAIASRNVILEEGRLFAVTTAGVSLFWFCGQAAFAALFAHDDWSFAAREANWPPVWAVAVLITVGRPFLLSRD